MADAYVEEDVCEEPIKRREQPDLTTEEGRLKYIQSLKDEYIARYKLKQTVKLKKQLSKKARLQAIESLGITEEEYNQSFGFLRREDDYVKLTEEEAKKIEATVHDLQHLQEDIVIRVSDPKLCVKAAREGKRNCMIDQYNLVERLKCHYLDVLASYYLKSEHVVDIITCRGKQFAKEEE